MSMTGLRVWLINLSLCASGGTIIFLAIAPVSGYPLTYGQVLRLAEIICPVFFGYLASAAHSVFATAHISSTEDSARASAPKTILVIAPVVLVLLIVVVSFSAFGLSNGVTRPPGTGMSRDVLAAFVASAMALLTVTTNFAVSHLFSAPQN